MQKLPEKHNENLTLLIRRIMGEKYDDIPGDTIERIYEMCSYALHPEFGYYTPEDGGYTFDSDSVFDIAFEIGQKVLEVGTKHTHTVYWLDHYFCFIGTEERIAEKLKTIRTV
jgi:hypothetical protein